MLNMGGPSTIPEVKPFLTRLFSDRDLIPLPLQQWSAPFIAARRTPKIERQYEEIGGGSPIRRLTEQQGHKLTALLDKLSPQTAPHKHYLAFRYSHPLTEETLLHMKKDGITRAIAFTQYPQYSCSTTGSSLNELWRKIYHLGLQDNIKWSVIDRWPTQRGLVKAFATRIRETLEKYSEADRKDVIILFSAHSLPLRVVERGDPYPHEVAATVHSVMEELQFSHPYRLVWQSKVGPLPWLAPQTAQTIEWLGKKGHKNLLIVPVAFTTDHIETLFELDIENGKLAKEMGVTGYKRVESLNLEPQFIQGMADLVVNHLQSPHTCSNQMHFQCPGCHNDSCSKSKLFFLHGPEGATQPAHGHPHQRHQSHDHKHETKHH